MTIWDILLGALAVWQIVEIWHHGSLFAGWRSRVELWDNWLGELLSCPFCLSVWVGLLVTAWLIFAASIDELWLYLPIFGLALARLANLGNDLSHRICRTPRGLTIEDDKRNHEHDNQDEAGA